MILYAASSCIAKLAPAEMLRDTPLTMALTGRLESMTLWDALLELTVLPCLQYWLHGYTYYNVVAHTSNPLKYDTSVLFFMEHIISHDMPNLEHHNIID